MPTGPNGEKRPKSNIQAAIVTAKIATGTWIDQDFPDAKAAAKDKEKPKPTKGAG